jgi:hypothetical protein
MKSLSIAIFAGAVAFAAIPINSASADPDVALEFEFVQLGQKRSEVVKALGAPTAETKSKTLGLQHRRLAWIADNRKYIVSFVADRVWRVKRCDLGGGVDC